LQQHTIFIQQSYIKGWHAVAACASIWKFKSLRVGNILQLNFRSWKVPHFTEGCKTIQFGGWVPASERNLQLLHDSTTPKTLKLKYTCV